MPRFSSSAGAGGLEQVGLGAPTPGLSSYLQGGEQCPDAWVSARF